MKKIYTFLKAKRVVFLDFEGVIKDSVAIKSMGYEKLFLPYGKDFANKVNRHHKDNNGVSRYEKISLYLSWAGEIPNPNQFKIFCDRYSELVQQAVIDSPWVPGVQEYLKVNCLKQYFVLITATPQEEIEQILKELNITCCFREVYGAPKNKISVVKDVLKRLNFLPDQALVIGDSATDLKAAKDNNVAFLLRCTEQNQKLQKKYIGLRFKKIKNE